MTSYKVSYFKARGAAEVIRLTLVAADQKFEDERLGDDEWKAFKPKTPMKAMPLLTVKTGGKETMYCQSGAIARYVARQFGLLGSTPEEDLLIDEVFESLQDTTREMYKQYFNDTEEKKKEAAENFEEVALPKFVEYIEKRMKEFGKGGFIIGSKMSLADIAVFCFVDQVTNLKKGALLDKYPSMKKHCDQIKADEKIAVWLAKRPQTEY